MFPLMRRILLYARRWFGVPCEDFFGSQRGKRGSSSRGQSALNRGDHSMLVSEVDVSYAMAWKEGRLRFKEKPLKEVMKIISRWYDVDVVYEDEEVKDYPFGCNFSRHATIEPLLKYSRRRVQLKRVFTVEKYGLERENKTEVGGTSPA